MNQKALVAQLLATRDTLSAAIAQIDAQLIALDVDLVSGERTACEHPAEKIEDNGTLGVSATEYTCTACGLTQDTPFISGD